MKSASVIVALAAAAGLAAVGFVRGTYAAGGSDSSCYALMADALASGKLQLSSVLASQVPWPDASKTMAPGGFVPSQSDPSAASPVCAPGFSLLLAPVVRLAGPNALFAVTPIAGALLVWLAFLAARTLAGPLAGSMAAVLMATSPVVLFQVVQPMNDITTAMLWMAVFVALISRHWGIAGLCCGLALLVRPNLLPLAAVAGIYVVVAPIPDPQSPIPDRMRRAALFGLAALPCVLVILSLNAGLYGGPLRSGYGQLNNLFSLSHVAVNATRYGRWLIETQTPAILAALLAPFTVERARRSDVLLALGLVAATAALYLTYTPFEDWSYVRFLLPAIALLVVLSSSTITILLLRGGATVGTLAVVLGMAAFGWNGVRIARDRLAFSMQALEQRYRSAGAIVRDRLPADAAILSTWDSGAIRFHAGKEAIVWDALDPAWLDRGLEWLQQHRHHPFIVVESWEEPKFRERFGAQSPIGKLDWPPKYEVDRVVRIYDPQDRAKYFAGQRVATEYLWPFLRK